MANNWEIFYLTELLLARTGWSKPWHEGRMRPANTLCVTDIHKIINTVY